MKVVTDENLDVDVVPQHILPKDYGGESDTMEYLTGKENAQILWFAMQICTQVDE